MVDDEIIHARIRRNGFKEAAGEFFVNSDQAKTLCEDYSLNFDDFLMGVFKGRNCWTCVFREKTYFVNASPLHEIENRLLDRILDDFFYTNGKETKEKVVEIRPGVKMWFANVGVGFAIENLFLLIAKD